MSELPPIYRDQRKVDDSHLKLLCIFHFIFAGLAFMGILFLLVHFTIFHAFLENPKFSQNQKGLPPAEFFAIFKWFYLIFGSWLSISIVLNVISAFFLRMRKHRIFSLVVAGINCIHVPFGTVLGVFTIIVLMQESIQESYGAKIPSAISEPVPPVIH